MWLLGTSPVGPNIGYPPLPVKTFGAAHYISGWLKILKQDYRALVKAASLAQKGFEYICALEDGLKQPTAEEAPEPPSRSCVREATAQMELLLAE